MAGPNVVHYEDGKTAEFNPNKPKLLLAIEKQFGVQSPEKHEHIFWLAHFAVGGDVPFDDWIDKVEEVDTVGVEPDSDDEGKGQSSTP
jgi:hypothetical protein